MRKLIIAFQTFSNAPKAASSANIVASVSLYGLLHAWLRKTFSLHDTNCLGIGFIADFCDNGDEYSDAVTGN
jgi:hypothetical protein